MTAKWTISLALLIPLLIPALAIADDVPPESSQGKLSLEQVVEATLAHYPALKAAGLMAEAAGMDADIAAAQGSPTALKVIGDWLVLQTKPK